ncbi:hypothetical protein JCM8202_005594 [Rhodotorula sphaerocarpa]
MRFVFTAAIFGSAVFLAAAQSSQNAQTDGVLPSVPQYPFGSQVESCGACIAGNIADLETSASYVILLQLAGKFSQECGQDIALVVPPQLSSMLSDAGSAGIAGSFMTNVLTSATAGATAGQGMTSAAAPSSSATSAANAIPQAQQVSTASTTSGAKASPCLPALLLGAISAMAVFKLL